MKSDAQRRLYPKNPLGIIALFVFFIEAISTVSLKFMLDAQSAYVGHIVWFVILYPSIIALLFFVILLLKHESLYGPADFRDDASFVQLLKKVENLEYKQEASQIDPRAASATDAVARISKLVDVNEIDAAIHVGQAFLKVRSYQNSLEIFEYLKTRISRQSESYTRILARLSYSLIGLKRYKEAIELLLVVHKERPDEKFHVWHALGLAYSYYMTGNQEEYTRWLEYAQERPEYRDRLPLARELYPEFQSDLLAPVVTK